jgi:hypothetical protein
MHDPMDLLFDLVVGLLITILNLSVSRHALYWKFLSTDVLIVGFLSILSISFAPTLVDTYRSSLLPTIAFFKTLPSDFEKKWAVYVRVLEKDGHRPKLYIGSATAASGGVSIRLQQYEKPHMRPFLVRLAMSNGYDITYTGLLCWSPIPPTGTVPISRLVFLALESMFTFIFWALGSKTETDKYGADVTILCPWPTESLEYDGCCTHNSLTEGPVGDFDLSPAELEAAAIRR